jgi:hypothetical protein
MQLHPISINRKPYRPHEVHTTALERIFAITPQPEEPVETRLSIAAWQILFGIHDRLPLLNDSAPDAQPPAEG